MAQALTEASKRAPKALVVASIPSSDIEIGGANGKMALDVLKNVFERVAKPWRPASGDSEKGMIGAAQAEAESQVALRRRWLPGGEPGIHTERASGLMPPVARPATGPVAPVP